MSFDGASKRTARYIKVDKRMSRIRAVAIGLFDPSAA
jgi:hypothetical protein